MNGYRLFAEFLFGMLGTGYFIYGKKRSNFVALGCGMALAVFPYFVDSLAGLAAAGIVLAALPFVVKGE